LILHTIIIIGAYYIGVDSTMLFGGMCLAGKACSMSSGYDPLEVTERVYARVSRVRDGIEERLYFRFRKDRWYGGIASADVIGCNLSCRFCWGWYFRDDLRRGKWYDPCRVAEKLIYMADRYRLKYIRLTGAEPTITRRHLVSVIEYVTDHGYHFILETNGILIGAHPDYAEELSKYSRLIIRVSFKGVTPDEFHYLTGARRDAWYLQLKALENLLEHGLKPGDQVYPAAMIGWSSDEDIEWFLEKLRTIHPALTEVDWEYVILYRHVVKLLRKTGLWPPRRYVYPGKIPEEMI